MATSPQEANSRATRDGRYSYDKDLLGCGAFGSVLKAHDKERDGEVVAVKIVKATKSLKEYFSKKPPASMEGMKREAEMLLRLKHDHVIAIRDHFEFKGSRMGTVGLAIVMDYCGGGNLQSRLELLNSEKKRLDADQRFRWYKQLATALAFIHGQEIVHRDLKPPNILVDSKDNLKIADIGVAKALYDIKSSYKELASEHSSYQQYMQTLAGSPAYMAPEVWDQHYKSSSDVFSLGLIMLVICEIPDPPIPEAEHGNEVHSLGVLMYTNETAQRVKASKLLKVKNCPEMELELFDDMLQYDFHNRPAMELVVRKLEEMERSREQERADDQEDLDAKDGGAEKQQSRCVLQ